MTLEGNKVFKCNIKEPSNEGTRDNRPDYNWNVNTHVYVTNKKGHLLYNQM